MAEESSGRFEVVEEKGSPHGDLYELEQTTYYHVVDRYSKETLMTFLGEMEASLSRDTGLWDDYRFYGVCEVTVAPDELAVIVRYCDGHEELVPLPQ